jgi:hypothetical protein
VGDGLGVGDWLGDALDDGLADGLGKGEGPDDADGAGDGEAGVPALGTAPHAATIRALRPRTRSLLARIRPSLSPAPCADRPGRPTNAMPIGHLELHRRGEALGDPDGAVGGRADRPQGELT